VASRGLVRRLLFGQLRYRPGRAAALGLAILVAAASFTLLTASARTSELHVRGTLTKNFRGAYDILVRPRGSFTPLEQEQGLVRDNYLSGIYGGITRKQYATVKRIPGVEVAAPIANIGTVLPSGVVTLSLNRFLTGARDQLIRVHFSSRAQRGLSEYPGGDVYVYYTHRQFFLWPTSTPSASVVVADPGRPQPLPICNGFGLSRPTEIAPFAAVNSRYLNCYTTHVSPGLRAIDRTFGLNLAPRNVTVRFAFFFPISLAAIDPLEESKLVHLDHAIVSGSYLKESTRPSQGKHQLAVPVIASSRNFLDEQLVATVQRLRIPASSDVPALLAAGACSVPRVPCEPTNIVPGPPGDAKQTAYRFVSSLQPGPVIGLRVFSAADAYRGGRRSIGSAAYWTGAPVRYRRLGPSELQAVPVKNGDETWINDFSGDTSYYDQPTDNLDVQFRPLVERRASNLFVNGVLAAPSLHTIGTFDPRRLPGFSALSHVPLETYYPPSLQPADAASKAALQGKTLLPSGNVGDYVSQPPLLLTNLAGLQPFLDDSRFGNLSPRQQRAPISVIRVRVAGVKGPDRLSQTRIKTVAQLIHERTGLAVDVTAGSSPTPITVALPAGRFGRPALKLTEGWVKKGVAVAYLRALDRKDLALFALILVVCAFFLGNGAFASVRARRSELGTLLTLGWSRGEIFRMVIAELALVGAIAGTIGTGLAAALVAGFSLHIPLLHVLLVLPIAVVLALAAGAVPAWQAARGKPLDAILPPVSGTGHGRRVRGTTDMAFANLRRLPGRTLVGAAGLVLGVAALTLLVGIEHAFSGTLVSTVLGNAVSVQVRGADFVALGLTLGLSALCAADVLYLNLRERQAELTTLETLGWSRREVRRLIGLEALLLAVSSSLAGATLGVVVGITVLGVGFGALLIGAAAAAGAALLATLVASLLPLLRLRRLSPPVVLAAE
jgi:putative ABC transport system permease protein